MNKRLPAVCISIFCSALISAGAFAQGSKTTSPHQSAPAPGLKEQHPKMDTPAVFPKRRSRLMVSASHNEYFPPLPEDLRPGAIFDENKIDVEQNGPSRWYEVPKWISGEYSYGYMTGYYEKNFRTGIESHKTRTAAPLPSGRMRGIITDRSGRIWQKAYGTSLHDPNKTEDGDYIEKKFDDEITGMIVGPDDYVENSFGSEFYIRREDNRIALVTRWERIREFHLDSKGEVLVNVSEEQFGTDGKPLIISKMRGSMIKRHEYVPLAPGQENDVAGSYEEAVRDLKKFLDATGAVADLPDVGSPEKEGKDTPAANATTSGSENASQTKSGGVPDKKGETASDSADKSNEKSSEASGQ